MADEILLDYITTLLRTKGGGLQLAHAASVLSDAASSSLLLDARKTDNAAGLAEVSTKAKSLAQGKNTDQKVAGLRSLAVFAAQGSQAEFLSNFADWATDAMNPLRTWESQSEDVLDACWHLITAIMHRAGKLLHVPGVRRDAAPLATKITSAIVQPVQKGRAPTCEALHALHAALLAIPSSFKQHAKALEPILGGAVLTGTSSSSARTAAAVRCFAALPRAAGDADAWSSAAQRVLATAHSLLDTAYLNLEPPGLVDSCRQGLDPGAVPVAGTGLATPSSCPSDSSVSKLAAVDSYLLVFSQIEAVLATLCSQLTATYPMPVPLPTSAILLLATRLLSVDADSLSGRAAASTGKLAELCLRLPVLHSSAFVLLETLITAAGVQLTPLMMSIARLLGNQLGKVAVDPMEATNEPSSQYKKALFGATSTFLRSGGMAAARHLAPTVIQCSSVEFYGTAAPTEGAKGAGQFGTRRGEMQPPRKKAKHTQHAGDEFIGGTGAGNAGATSEIAALGSQMAFLGLLEAVLEGGAALLTPAQRAKIDDVIAHAASTSSDAALVAVHAAEGDASPLVGLQLAALKALLASVLAPAGHRPPHVALAVSLFRRGLRHQSNSIASFSNHVSLIELLLRKERANGPFLHNYINSHNVNDFSHCRLCCPARLFSIPAPCLVQHPSSLLLKGPVNWVCLDFGAMLMQMLG